MDFQDYFKQQALLHPSMGPRDVVKLCYQATYGGEHILRDLAAAERYFNAEFERLTPLAGELYEQISPEICRVNMAVWKQRGLPGSWLFRLFCLSSERKKGSEEELAQRLQLAEDCFAVLSFSREDWQAFLTEYRALGGGAVHHSSRYREAEAPAYRLLHTDLLPLLPLLESLQEHLCKKGAEAPTVIAVDGRAGAGKSSLAACLADLLAPASTVYMDDFFLPPALRTEQRLAACGGNLHYERFAEEVLPYLRGVADFSYRCFDCSVMDYGELRRVQGAPIYLVEGSYSHHPYLGDYADLRVFVDVEPALQLERITARNGERMAELFKSRWIPMEEQYFRAFAVREAADIVLSVDFI